MQLNYPALISEPDEALIQREHEQRGTHRYQGLHTLLQRGASPGRPTHLHLQAWQDLEAQMQAGHIASLKDAQA
jgi:hypothetical protein